jgi:hypothetical protein
MLARLTTPPPPPPRLARMQHSPTCNAQWPLHLPPAMLPLCCCKLQAAGKPIYSQKPEETVLTVLPAPLEPTIRVSGL